MELYEQRSSNMPQKLWTIACELALLILAYHILFGNIGVIIFHWLEWGNPIRKLLSKGDQFRLFIDDFHPNEFHDILSFKA